MGYGMVLMAQIGPWPSKKEPLSQTRKKFFGTPTPKTPHASSLCIVASPPLLLYKTVNLPNKLLRA